MKKNTMPPHTSPDLTQNILSDRLWVPLRYMQLQNHGQPANRNINIIYHVSNILLTTY
jgi:hypothetical protein